MTDVQCSSSSGDEEEYQTCDEDEDEDTRFGVPRAPPQSSSSSEDGRDWTYYHHTSDEEDEETEVRAAPEVEVRKETRHMYTSSYTGFDPQQMIQSCVDKLVQSQSQHSNEPLDVSGRQHALGTLAIPSGGQHAEGTLGIPSGSQDAEGTLAIPSGSQHAEGTLAIPPGSQHAEGTLAIPPGSQDAEGTLAIPSGSQDAEGTLAIPPGSQHAEVIMAIPSGSQHAEGTLAIPSRNALMNKGCSGTTLNVQMNVTQNVKVEKATNVNQSFGGSQNVSETATIHQGQQGGELSRADRIMNRTISHLQAWNQGMVRTAALDQVLEKLNSGATWLTIKGNPGEGKTTVGLMALEELHRCGRQVFEVRSPDDFTEIIETCSRPVIMLDDVFGNLEFNQAEWLTWKPAVSPFLKEREHRSHEKEDTTSKTNVTVILIGRDYVLNSANVDLGRLSYVLTSDKHVVYMDNSVERSFEEKRAIWETISRSSGVRLDKMTVDEILRIEVPHGYPHVCRLFTTIHKKNKAISPIDFFKKPLEFLNESVANLSKDTSTMLFFKEIIKGEGKISIRELGRLDPTYKITQTAYNLVGTYIRVEEDYFEFDHPSIYDSVAFHLCSRDPIFVIVQCHLSFIHERVRILFSHFVKSTNCFESSLVVNVNRCYAEDLAVRFAAEIMARNFLHVLSHQVFTVKTFVGMVMSRIQTPLKSLLPLTDQKHSSHYNEITFLSLVPSSKSPELLKYIDNCKDITLTDADERTLLYGTCRYAASDVLTYLINTRQSLDINVRFISDETPLMIAAETRDVDFVNKILSLSPDLKARNVIGRTILHFFIQHGLVTAVTRVIESRIDIKAEDNFRTSPLSLACRYNQLEVITQLIEKGASVDVISLHEACCGGNIHIVQLLIEKGTRVDQASLLAACRGKNLHIVQLLIEKGARVDQLSLHEACTGGNLHIVQLLIDKGARVDQESLHGACRGGNIHVVKLLNKQGARVDQESLHAACRGGNIHVAQLLIEKGARVDEESLYGACEQGNLQIVQLLTEKGARVVPEALHAACIRGNLHIVQLLIEKLERIDQVILHASCRKENLHIVQLLIEKGAIVDQESLHAACGGENLHIVQLLIEKGARVDQESLEEACTAGNIHIVQLLIEKVARVEQKSLRVACIQADLSIVQLLLDKGAKFDQETLHAACTGQNLHIVQLLIEKGARVDRKSLHLACVHGNLSIVELLIEKGAIFDEESLPAACRGENLNIVQLLIGKGARVDQESLHAACRGENLNIVQLLIEKGARVDQELLNTACLRGNFRVVQLLVEKGARVDEESFHAACRGGNLHIVQLLIEKGARADQESLHAACRGRNIHIVQLLIEKGARVDQESFRAACRGGNLHMIELLFEKENNPKTDILSLCLWSASERVNIDISRYLVQKCASSKCISI